MANWHLNYGLNLNASGSKKLQCNLSDKGGNGIQLVMGGGIPEGGKRPLADVVKLLQAKVVGLDELDADDPKNHAKQLKAVAEYCTELAAILEAE